MTDYVILYIVLDIIQCTLQNHDEIHYIIHHIRLYYIILYYIILY